MWSHPVPRLLAFLLFSLSTLSAHAAPPAAIAAFSKDLATLDGRFEQQVFEVDGTLREQSGGRVALQAPRQFRWDYQEPFPQTIVADGDRVWVYDPDLEQVTVRQQAQEEQSNPLAALIDPGVLEQQFKVGDDGERDGLQWIGLTPRKLDDAAFAEAHLGFRDGALMQMEMRDTLGQKTVIRFFEWQRNTLIEAVRFRFVPPAGVDVVGDPGEDAEVFPVKQD